MQSCISRTNGKTEKNEKILQGEPKLRATFKFQLETVEIDKFMKECKNNMFMKSLTVEKL